MAYISRRRSTYGARRRTSTVYRRKYPARRRSLTVYRRSFRKRAPMRAKTSRQILNLTSRKKSDNMLAWGGTAFNSAPSQGPLVIPGDKAGGAVIAWMPTARDKTRVGVDTDAGVEDESTRTASTVFMKLLRERIEIQTDSPHTWLWRRIVFTFKGMEILLPSVDAGAKASPGTLYLENPNGYTRFMADLNRTDDINPDGNTAIRDQLLSVLFRGQIDKDWITGQSAAVDTKRVTVLHDSKCMLKSGNDRGSAWIKMKKHWFLKNLVYDDDEFGDTTVKSEHYSTRGKAGMGDVYVVDFVEAAFGGTNSDHLRFYPQATLYWHER